MKKFLSLLSLILLIALVACGNAETPAPPVPETQVPEAPEAPQDPESNGTETSDPAPTPPPSSGDTNGSSSDDRYNDPMLPSDGSEEGGYGSGGSTTPTPPVDDNDDDDIETDENGQLLLTLSQLSRFDGREGRRAFIAVAGIVYEVTGSPAWPNGLHQGRVQAGQDLTNEIDTLSPHGRGYLDRVPRVGRIIQD